jgi:hypothetical protein
MNKFMKDQKNNRLVGSRQRSARVAKKISAEEQLGRQSRKRFLRLVEIDSTELDLRLVAAAANAVRAKIWMDPTTGQVVRIVLTTAGS